MSGSLPNLMLNNKYKRDDGSIGVWARPRQLLGGFGPAGVINTIYIMIYDIFQIGKSGFFIFRKEFEKSPFKRFILNR